MGGGGTLIIQLRPLSGSLRFFEQFGTLSNILAETCEKTGHVKIADIQWDYFQNLHKNSKKRGTVFRQFQHFRFRMPRFQPIHNF